MTRASFGLSVSVDRHTGQVMAAYFRLREGKVDDTREVVEGKAFADYDDSGLLIGLELIGSCSVDQLLLGLGDPEPEVIGGFLRRTAPREMVAI